ncbi:MAG: mechanosensitive ion channel family protein [Thermoanaerobaculia bacterium]|jgi:small-conductance mechanosensitive channel
MRKSILSLAAIVTFVLSHAHDARGQAAAATPSAAAVTATDAPREPAFAPVVLDGTTILRVATLPGAVSARQRASEASARLEDFADNAAGTEVEIKVVATGETRALVSAGTFLLAVAPQDAALEGIPLDTLAQRNADAIRAAIAGYRNARTAKTIMTRAGLMAVAWLGFIMLIRAVRAGSRALRLRLRSLQESRLERSRVRGVGMQLVEQVVMFALAILRLFVALLLLVLFLTLVTLTLRVFPQTGAIADSVLESERGAAMRALLAIVDYLPSFVFLVVIVVVTWYLLKGFRLFFDALERQDITFPGFLAEWAHPTYSLARFLVIVFAAVVAFPYLPGGGSDALKGVSLFFGVLFSLGSTSAVSNVVSGVILTYMHPYRVGDFVEIGGTTGTVVKRDFLVTRIRTIKNEEVTIPNGAILVGQMRNYSTMASAEGLIVHTAITIGYDAPWRRVHELMVAAAKSTEGIIESPAPFVWQTSLNDYHVSYEINAYTRTAEQLFRIQADLHRNIQDRFNEAGVEIMSPAFAALRDGNSVTTPAAHRPEGYEPPGFRVSQIPGEKR